MSKLSFTISLLLSYYFCFNKRRIILENIKRGVKIEEDNY